MIEKGVYKEGEVKIVGENYTFVKTEDSIAVCDTKDLVEEVEEWDM